MVGLDHFVSVELCSTLAFFGPNLGEPDARTRRCRASGFSGFSVRDV